jgi:hypothetical protein
MNHGQGKHHALEMNQNPRKVSYFVNESISKNIETIGLNESINMRVPP